jgi:hypothetical protein
VIAARQGKLTFRKSNVTMAGVELYYVGEAVNFGFFKTVNEFGQLLIFELPD